MAERGWDTKVLVVGYDLLVPARVPLYTNNDRKSSSPLYTHATGSSVYLARKAVPVPSNFAKPTHKYRVHDHQDNQCSVVSDSVPCAQYGAGCAKLRSLLQQVARRMNWDKG